MATISMRSGEYLLSVLGYAALRDVFHDPLQTQTRIAEMRGVIEGTDHPLYSTEVTFSEHDVIAGYTEWSKSYDRPGVNPAIILEESIVHPILASVAPGRALDVACGTGRHALHLASLGHAVIGVDATVAMLDRARVKAPTIDFREGRFDALPVEDASVDVLTCALALCHVTDLAPAVREFGRVLAPGGVAIISDMHPISTLTGGAAAFPSADLATVPFVRNHVHHISEYFDAFRDAELEVAGLAEGISTEEHAKLLPSYLVFPEATVHAFTGQPSIVVWTVTKPE